MKAGDKCRVLEVTRFDKGRGFKSNDIVTIDHVNNTNGMVDCVTEEGINHPFHSNQLQKVSKLDLFLKRIGL